MSPKVSLRNHVMGAWRVGDFGNVLGIRYIEKYRCPLFLSNRRTRSRHILNGIRSEGTSEHYRSVSSARLGTEIMPRKGVGLGTPLLRT